MAAIPNDRNIEFSLEAVSIGLRRQPQPKRKRNAAGSRSGSIT